MASEQETNAAIASLFGDDEISENFIANPVYDARGQTEEGATKYEHQELSFSEAELLEDTIKNSENNFVSETPEQDEDQVNAAHDAIIFKCGSCKLQFATKSLLNQHTIVYHTRGKIQDTRCKMFCPYLVCSFSTIDTTNLMKHIKTEHDEAKQTTGDNDCELPEISDEIIEDDNVEGDSNLIKLDEIKNLEETDLEHFPKEGQPKSVEELLANISQKNLVTKCYKCKICNEFADTRILTVRHHLEAKHFLGQIGYTCKLCNWVGHFAEACKAHRRKNHRNSEELKLLTETDAKSWIGRWRTGKDLMPDFEFNCLKFVKCEKCYKTFRNKTKLQNHIKIEHKSFKSFLACEACGRKFTSYSQLNTHKSNVHKILTAKCKGCDKKFLDTRALKEHIENDHNGLPFLCIPCGKRFPKRNNIKLHNKKYHDPAKPRGTPGPQGPKNSHRHKKNQLLTKILENAKIRPKRFCDAHLTKFCPRC